MLATILKSDVATQISIAIMDAFVMMRKYVSNELIEQKYINNLVIKHDEDIKLLQESFSKKEIYHCGSSINYAGNKTFSINKIEDKIVKNSLIKYVLTIIE